jgi:hypothetical protein
MYTDEKPSNRLYWSLIVREYNQEPKITSGVVEDVNFYASKIKLINIGKYYLLMVDEINKKA